jgi:nucleoside-diphosphate-sugar epimerase
MKILVTGGTGFTGKALTRRLLGAGHHVVVLDCKEGLDTDELRDEGARVVLGSVTDRRVVAQCMSGVEVVFHLAAAFRELNVPDRHYEDVNVNGTRLVLEEALRNRVRKVVHCSTCGVHGNVSQPPADEDAPISFGDYYQETKWRAEPIVREFNTRGLSTVILRPTAIYGPGDVGRFRLLFDRVAKGMFPMFGSGKTLYHPLYIDNLIDVFLLAMQPGVGDSEAYLIGDDDYVEIETLVHKVAEALGQPVRIPHFPLLPVIVAGHLCEAVCKPFGVAPPIFPRRVDWYRQNRAFSIEKAKRGLEYQPKVALAEGLRRTATWYRAKGFLPTA